jgi:acyl-CoA synthetase (NDP forming)
MDTGNDPLGRRGRATYVDFAAIDALLRQAQAAGRSQLAPGEITRLAAYAGIDILAPTAIDGARLYLGLRRTREFGMVIQAGVDKVLGDETLADRHGPGMVSASTLLADADELLHRCRRAFGPGGSAGTPAAPAGEDRVRERLAALIALGNYDGPCQPGHARLVLDELVLDPAGGAYCRFGPAQPEPVPRSVAKIGKLLHPRSIGLIGASASKMNFGRIILHNLIASGYDIDRMVIIRPGEPQIDGVRCIESLTALDHKLDLLVVAVGADAVFDLVDEIIALGAAESVMLIPGGLGETEASREASARMCARIAAAQRRDGGGPVFLGGNCLGVVSHRGGYDSWFIPQERLPRTRKRPRRNSALVSQSGAFMITRLSQNPWLDPDTMVALGNQSDLTHGDLLAYLADDEQIDVIGCYIEGFRDLDGLAFARAVRAAVLKGKQVVVYKAGRTPAGALAALGHTGSSTGDHALCAAVLAQAGAIVVKDIAQFDDLFYIAGALHDKRIGGNRLGAVSGAGFETVGMADSIWGDDAVLQIAPLGEAVATRLAQILIAKKLDALMEVRNPLDINPGADDEAHVQCTQAMLDDPDIDAVVVGLDPVSPAMRALEHPVRAGFDIRSEGSVVQQLAKLAAAAPKPVIGVVDGGRLYDAMAAGLMDGGVCVFRSSQRGVEALLKYTGARLYAEQLRRRQD